MPSGSTEASPYGDEIGMRYLPDLPNVEGSVCNPAYNRAGCRTPMQWDAGPNASFSTAEASRLYLPVDPSPDRPTVAAQNTDPSSTLNFVRALITLRQATPALRTRASTRVINEGYPFAYVRGESHLVVVNPRREPAMLVAAEAVDATALFASGVSATADGHIVAGFGYGVFALQTPHVAPAWA